ncbi:hypothetical protein FRC01_005484 [Tulasnella sp. 417]|nr:hypothetical protein FRC01_005484 [Tulasnella sp. 417]
MSLTQPKALALPVEVVDMIANWISRPRDLLSLALSHSRFHRVIIPDHLHYRHVEFCIFDYAMWKYLLEDPYCLRKIETIQLSANCTTRVPPIEAPSNELNTQDAIVDPDLIRSAFKDMRLLHAVVWDSEYASHRRAAHIRIIDLLRSVWDGVNRYCSTRIEPFANLGQITTVTYQATCYLHSLPGSGGLTFLSSFPRLQHLTLLGGSSSAGSSPSLLSMKFPLLESLIVNDLPNTTINDLLEFLAAHPLLHTFKFCSRWGLLSTDTSTIAGCNVAPHLEILDSPQDLVQVLFQTSDSEPGSRRPLRTLCTTLPLDTRDPPEARAILSKIGPQLEELVMDEERQPVYWLCPDLGSPLSTISSAFPNLRLLDFGSVYITKCQAPGRDARPKMHDWISALSGFNHLVALTIPWSQAEGTGMLVRSSPSKRRHKTMEQFLNHCPRLRFLFCRSRWASSLEPRKELSILIGYNGADIRFRGARLIDDGSIEDRKWAVYDGEAKDLADEVSAAVRARVG